MEKDLDSKEKSNNKKMNSNSNTIFTSEKMKKRQNYMKILK